MTIQEAIELLVNATYSEEWQGNEDLQTAHNMAIEALHRENPKNPIINIIADSYGTRRLNEMWSEDSWLCPVCHRYVGDVFDELYCSKCGQKIIQKRIRVIK